MDVYKCRIEFESEYADAVTKAIAYGDNYSRSRTTVGYSGNNVFIEICANDVTALRAAFNDVVRLIRVCDISRWLNE